MKTVVFYAYYETLTAALNLDYFIKHAISYEEDILFIIIINDKKCSVPLPDYKNCMIINRENNGFDFGAHKCAIEVLKSKHKCSLEDLPFDYYIFMNSSVTGPFLPLYYPKNLHWSNIFISKITDKVKLVGTSITVLPHTDDGGYGPKVEGFCFATDKIGFNILANKNDIFMYHPTKYHVIIYSEYGMTKEIFKHGYSIDCLLYKYKDIDWSNSKNWPEPNHPSTRNGYDGINIHPFEVVFHKCFWNNPNDNGVAAEYFVKYIEWGKKIQFQYISS